jgi:hypothetical protein
MVAIYHAFVGGAIPLEKDLVTGNMRYDTGNLTKN